jgi:hypothetical protein
VTATAATTAVTASPTAARSLRVLDICMPSF